MASTAAARGHRVTLFEEQDELGGQFNWPARVPGKTEFNEMLRYFMRQIESAKVDVRLGVRATPDDLATEAFDKIVIATGILPRKPDIDGIDHPSVVSYLDVLLGRVEVGRRVAIIGTGGIGYDVAEFLTHAGHGETAIEHFLSEYGVDTHDLRTRWPEAGAACAIAATGHAVPARAVAAGWTARRLDRMDPAQPAARPRCQRGCGRCLREDRRSGAALSRQWRTAGCSRSTTS